MIDAGLQKPRATGTRVPSGFTKANSAVAVAVAHVRKPPLVTRKPTMNSTAPYSLTAGSRADEHDGGSLLGVLSQSSSSEESADEVGWTLGRN